MGLKKILSIAELQASRWPKILEETFGENLVSAFVHGDCMMEGFNAITTPWTMSFVLKSNTAADLLPLQKLIKEAQLEGIQFCYFFTPKEILSSADVFALEYLHISMKHEVICGKDSFYGFIPGKNDLRLECERELRGLLIRLKHHMIYSTKLKENPFAQVEQELLPILYGVYFLKNGTYPENHQEVFSLYPELHVNSVKAENLEELYTKYIETLNKIVNDVDTMEVA